MYFPSGFPKWCCGKETACQCRRGNRHGFDPWLGRSPGGRNGKLLQYSCLENSTDRGAWQATVHGVAKSDMTEGLTHTHTHTHTHSWESPLITLNIWYHCVSNCTVFYTVPLTFHFLDSCLSLHLGLYKNLTFSSPHSVINLKVLF